MIEYGGVQLKGCICELKFGYDAKTGVYTKSSCSDIPKLYAIGFGTLIIYKKQINKS